jgi:hypothetical protein
MAEDGFSTVCVIDLLLGKKRIRTADLRGGLATLRNTWAPVRKASRGPFVSRLGGGLAPALAMMSGLQQLIFKTLSR